MFILFPLFVVTAVIYSSVGLGGGSTYIALLSFAELPPNVIASTGLTLNIIVVTIGFYHFRKAGFLDLRSSWPLIATSAPGAFIGGQISLHRNVYYLFLAIILIFIATVTLFKRRTVIEKPHLSSKVSFLSMFVIGLSLGLVSGIFGIGGGVILCPILILVGLADAKQAAAIATVFILVNSLSGIFGRALVGNYAVSNIIFLAIAVALGAFIGARLVVTRLSRFAVQRIQGAVLLIAGARLLFLHIGL